MTKPLDQDWILRVHKAAISAALSNNREALLALLDAGLRSRLSLQDDPSAQILSDLGRLNVYGPKNEPLESAPIAIWLKSAIALTEGLDECSVFQEALQNLRPQVEPKVNAPVEPKPPPPPPPPSKPPWPLIAAIVLIAAIGGGIAYLVWPPDRTTTTQTLDGGSTTQMPDAGKVKPPGPDAGPKPGTDGGTTSVEPDAGVEPYCQEPPAYSEGKYNLIFGFLLEEAEAKESITKMTKLLSRHGKRGPSWSKAIDREHPSIRAPNVKMPLIDIKRWNVYFANVNGDEMCDWLGKCSKEFPKCSARAVSPTPTPTYAIDPHKLLVPEKQP